jgi:hypothetical protein
MFHNRFARAVICSGRIETIVRTNQSVDVVDERIEKTILDQDSLNSDDNQNT